MLDNFWLYAESETDGKKNGEHYTSERCRQKKLYDVSMLINTAFKLAVAKCFTFLGILVFVTRQCFVGKYVV